MGELANLWEIFCNWLKGGSLAVKFVVGMDTKIKQAEARINIVTLGEL